MKHTRFIIFSLCINQIAILCTIKVMAMVTSLVSLSMLTNIKLATLPLALYSIAVVIGTIIAPFSFHHFSRKTGHIIGILIGLAGLATCAIALVQQHFLLYVIGNIALGLCVGFARYYTYTAANAVSADKKAAAISYIVFAGVLTAILGPFIAEKTAHLIPGIPFIATYIALLGFNFIGLLLLGWTPLKQQKITDNKNTPPFNKRSLIFSYPFIAGTLATGLCYLVMTEIMVATPIAMSKMYRFPFSDIALAMQLHFLGMFAPSLISARLIKYIGMRWLLLLGACIYFVCCYVLVSGQSVGHFYLGLGLLGLGWNFLYIAGSNIIAQINNHQAKNFIQGANMVLTNSFNAIGAFIAGPLLFTFGWANLNLMVLPFCGALLLLSLFMWYRNIPHLVDKN